MTIETNEQLDHRVDEARASVGPARPTPPATGHDVEFPLLVQDTSLAELCHAAVEDVSERYPDRIVQYAPDTAPGAGAWDPRRISYAVTILLEDALQRTKPDEPVFLRWREHDGEVVIRVQYPRPLERGDRVVSLFEGGVRPDGADDSVPTLRLLVARKILLQHGGELARVRTHAGTTYVATLPRQVPPPSSTEANEVE
ncbi:MAG TPA: sensor histidine kinase [Anaeromyxobacteraceae bacterium]|nr:sensor histidine kinase [Anaeromyxobacteraceae bacterium]